MEAILIIGGIFLIAWIWRSNARYKYERDEDRAQSQKLLSRVWALENIVQELREQLRGSLRENPATKPDERLVTAAPAPSPASPPVVSPPAEVSDRSARSPLAPESVRKPISAPEISAPMCSLDADETSSQGGAFVPPPPPSFTTAGTSRASSASRKSWLDVEEILGTNWLNKIGIAMLVLGIAFFLALELKTLGPAGKILVGLVISSVMLGLGIYFDRKERYRILARAAIGGGWALLFFTTYAMYHVPAAHILSSQAVDLLLMLVVAAAMVVHTLRFRSQVVTGLAFLLAFLTVTISHSNVYSLSAGAVLATGLVVIVIRLRWFELDLFGILASYLNHFLWLRPIIEPMGGHRHPFPEFTASAGLLAAYWLIFRISYVFRRIDDQRQERVSTASALLNSVLLLSLFKYQSVYPQWTFWALLVLGALETLLGQLPITRRRRSAVIVLSTLGLLLLLAAFPFRYSGSRLSVLWLLEVEALLLIGAWTKEIIFRRMGMLAAILVSIQVIGVEAARIFGRRMDDADLRADFPVSILFVVAAAVFYANAHWLVRRWGELFTNEIDLRIMQRLSYAACVMLLIAAWIAFPESWTIVAWCALGLGLALAGRRWNQPELGYQANVLALLSVIRAPAINLECTQNFHGVSVRLVTIATVAVLLYITSRWSAAADRTRGITIKDHFSPSQQFASALYTWSASSLLALLAWYELRSVGVADAWLVGGLLLLEIGLVRHKLGLRLQAYVAFTAGFLRIFFVNLNVAGFPGEISPRFYTVVPLALGFFYAYWRLHDEQEQLIEIERKFRAGEICCWLGTATVASLMRFELPTDWVAASWAALVFGLLLLAWRSQRKVFLHQGLLLALGVAFRTALHNFYERSYFPAPTWESRWITAGTAIGLLFVSLPIAFRLRQKERVEHPTGFMEMLRWNIRRPEQLLFFIPVGLLTWLLAIEMRHGMVTLSWGLEGVAVFMLALWLGERSFRLTGLGLLLLCVGKILIIDVWRLDPRDRYLTFIVLGAALLLVSFLYTHNREKLRQFL